MPDSDRGVRSRITAHLDALPDSLDSLTEEVSVGRGLTLSLGALTERAGLADRDARAASWEAPEQIKARIGQVDAKDDQVGREFQLLASGQVQPAGPHVDPNSLSPAAMAAAEQAAAAVTTAYKALGEAHKAVLVAQLASAEQQNAEAAADGGRGRRRLRVPPSLAANQGAMRRAIRSELNYLLARKPRKVLRAVAFAVLSGAIYLAFIRLFQWNTYGRWAPYLACLFVSSVMATSACFNSFCFDAQRVRIALDKGARLWQILVVKNIALMLLVFPLGLAMSIALAILFGKPAALFAALALVICILLLWSGVGNLLTVILPIRDAPLKVHWREGTFKSFALEFAVTWAASSVVLFLLIWRVYSAKGMADRYSSTFIGIALFLGSGILAWIYMTVIATSFTNSPTVYRRLRRELDWAPADNQAAATGPEDGTLVGPTIADGTMPGPAATPG